MRRLATAAAAACALSTARSGAAEAAAGSVAADQSECTEWTRSVTRDDAAATTSAAVHAERLDRGYAACLFSRGWQPASYSDGAVQPPQRLVVGHPVLFTPTRRPVMVLCDDTTIVSIEDTGRSLRMTGLRAGETTCSFSSALTPGRRDVYRIVVEP